MFYLCITCKKEKSENDFSNYQKGHICKDCRSIYYRSWYLKNGRNRDKMYNRLYTREWQRKHRSEVKAEHDVALLARLGKKIKPTECEICKWSKTRLSGHHQDYSKPLEVIWVCGSCHKKIHQGLTQ